MRRARTAILPMLCLAALPIAGCGGGSEARSAGTTRSSATTASTQAPRPTSTSAPSPSAKDLIARADPVCRQLNLAIAEPKSHGLDLPKIAQRAPRNAVFEQHALAKLQRLQVPHALAGDWQKMMSYRRELARELRVVGKAAAEGSTAAVQAIAAKKLQIHRLLSIIAARDGFQDCGRVG